MLPEGRFRYGRSSAGEWYRVCVVVARSVVVTGVFRGAGLVSLPRSEAFKSRDLTGYTRFMTTPPASRRRHGASGVHRRLKARGRLGVGHVSVPDGLIKSVRVAGVARKTRAVMSQPADVAPVASHDTVGGGTVATSLQSMAVSGEAIAPSVRGPIPMPPPQGSRRVNVSDRLVADRDEERW